VGHLFSLWLLGLGLLNLGLVLGLDGSQDLRLVLAKAFDLGGQTLLLLDARVELAGSLQVAEELLVDAVVANIFVAGNVLDTVSVVLVVLVVIGVVLGFRHRVAL